jgi:hypothetical protein
MSNRSALRRKEAHERVHNLAASIDEDDRADQKEERARNKRTKPLKQTPGPTMAQKKAKMQIAQALAVFNTLPPVMSSTDTFSIFSPSPPAPPKRSKKLEEQRQNLAKAKQAAAAAAAAARKAGTLRRVVPLTDADGLDALYVPLSSPSVSAANSASIYSDDTDASGSGSDSGDGCCGYG